MLDFSQIKAVISDMDGVLWRGETALPGLHAFFELVAGRAIPFALATNNSMKSPADYVHKLAGFGLAVPEEAILNSGLVTMSYLRHHFPPGAGIHVFGGDGIRQLVRAAGFTLVDEGAVAVVVGLDFNLNYEKLKRAALLIRGGAQFVATNDDSTIPMPEGLAPGGGSMVAALRAATDRQPDAIMGKPHPPLFEAALDYLGSDPAHTLMIGDRMNTDIAGAARFGLKTALVLSGVATRAEAEASATPPDAIYADLGALVEAWGKVDRR
jgi:4-nitrophenyl phosphatase